MNCLNPFGATSRQCPWQKQQLDRMRYDASQEKRNIYGAGPCLRWSLATLLSVSIGCSWSRFDDILKNSPIQILNTPGDTNALGLSVAAMRGKSSTIAFALAADSYATYDFNERDLTSNDVATRGSCSRVNNCWTGNTVAAIGQDIDSVATACFAFGIESIPGEVPRVLLACEGNSVRGLALPDPIPQEITSLSPTSKAPRVHFAAGPRLAPDLLVAALPTSGVVWAYPVGASVPIAIPKPAAAGKSFGSAIAVGGTGGSRFIAVGEPEASNLYIFRTDGATIPTASLCISGSPNFGAALAAGHFTAADTEDLAINSDGEVMVLPALDDLPYSEAPTNPCVGFTELGKARTMSCETLKASKGCGGLLEFAALAAADLDGDGRDELLIGTPSASARGNDAAGKILVTSFGSETPRLLEELSPSSTESGDRLGTSVTGVPLARPEAVLAGAPGGNKLAAFFCTSLLATGLGGARCD